MKGNIKRICMAIVLSIILMFTSNISLAHSGRTDANGGHKDKNNVSGLGSYHYHCGGHPAHLHTNGVCPYSSSSSSSSSTKAVKPANITARTIKINEKIESIEVGESKILTATITPNDTTDKSIIWKSSDDRIATISSNGEIVAKKLGTIDITAITSNNKTSTIKISIKEEPKIENSAIINTSTNTINNTIETTDDKKDSNALAGVITLGLLGGGGYLTYKKHKKTK